MNRLRNLLTLSPDLTPSNRNLLLCAAIVAVSLMSFYVHLLQQSVERGEQRRSEQRSSTGREATKSSPQTARFGEAMPTRVVYDSNAAAR